METVSFMHESHTSSLSYKIHNIVNGQKNCTRPGVHENYWHVKMSLPINTAAVWYTSRHPKRGRLVPFCSSSKLSLSVGVLSRVTQSKGSGWSDHYEVVWQCDRYFWNSQTQQQHLRVLPGPEMGAQSPPRPGCSTWPTQV